MKERWSFLFSLVRSRHSSIVPSLDLACNSPLQSAVICLFLRCIFSFAHWCPGFLEDASACIFYAGHSFYAMHPAEESLMRMQLWFLNHNIMSPIFITSICFIKMACRQSIPLCYKGLAFIDTTMENINSQEKTWPEARSYNLAKKQYKRPLGVRQRLNFLCKCKDNCWQDVRNGAQIPLVGMSTC